MIYIGQISIRTNVKNDCCPKLCFANATNKLYEHRNLLCTLIQTRETKICRIKTSLENLLFSLLLGMFKLRVQSLL